MLRTDVEFDDLHFGGKVLVTLLPGFQFLLLCLQLLLLFFVVFLPSFELVLLTPDLLLPLIELL